MKSKSQQIKELKKELAEYKSLVLSISKDNERLSNKLVETTKILNYYKRELKKNKNT